MVGNFVPGHSAGILFAQEILQGNKWVVEKIVKIPIDKIGINDYNPHYKDRN